MNRPKTILLRRITRIPFVLFFAICLFVISPVHAAWSVDLILIPSHIPGEFSLQPPLYDYGEPVVVNVTLMNHGPRAITVMGYPPNRGISHRNQTDFLTFQRASATATIAAGYNLTFDFTWDQKDAQGLQVESGLYTLAVYYLFSDNATEYWDTSHVTSYVRTIDIVVLPGGGALIADIPINQVQVLDNVSVTLESIHSTNTTGWVNFTFQVPEDIPYWTHPQGWKRCYLDFIPIEAQYYIDHNIPHELFYSSVSCDPPHTFQSIYELDPIPADAHEMEINITASGSHLGSRIFRVNLTPYSRHSGEVSGSSRPLSTTKPAPLPAAFAIIAVGCIALIAAIRK